MPSSILNSDDGVISGTSGLKSSGGDDGVLNIQNNGTTAVTVNASGNVGIGTTSPGSFASNANNLVIGGGTGDEGLTIYSGNSSNDSGDIYFADGTTGNDLFAGYLIYQHDTDVMRFGTVATERMRIDSSGNVQIGTTSNFATYGGNRLSVVQSSSTNNGSAAALATNYSGDLANHAVLVSKYDNNTTTSQRLIGFLINQGASGQGQINANGANAAAFGTFSDERLKENIEDLPLQLNKIMALRPVEFDYKSGGHQIGFIAQEIRGVYPDVVGEDGGEENYLTVTGWSKTEARLVKAIQELKAELDEAKARIAALEQA
jgi:hypothetical protein